MLVASFLVLVSLQVSALDAPFAVDSRGPAESPGSADAEALSSEAPGPSAAGPSEALPPQADPSQADPSQADPSQADPSQADPSQADPSRADPSQALSSEAPSPSEATEAVVPSDVLDMEVPEVRSKRSPDDRPANEDGPLEGQPLPPAPTRADPAALRTNAWRGVGFFQIHIAAMVPVAGERPAFGTVASAGGGLQLGWRFHRFIAAGAGLTTFLHDHDDGDAVNSAGETVEVRDFGRMTLFDAAFIRAYVPMRRRIEPRFDVGALLGSYRPPVQGDPQFAGGVRVGAGLDVWVGRSFSLDFGVDPRVLVVDGRVGLTMQAGMGATVHW